MFHTTIFLNALLVFVLPITALGIIVAVLRAKKAGEQPTPPALGTYVGAYVLGLVIVAGWLSWSPTRHGLGTTLKVGPPVDFPTWQVIAFIVCAVAGAVIVGFFTARVVRDRTIAAFVYAAGFATAFALGDAFGTPSQGGVGIAGSFLVVVPVTLLCGVVARRVTDARRSRHPKRAG